MNNSRDTHTLFSNPDGIMFATQKDWNQLPADDMSFLEHYMIIFSKPSAGSCFFMLRNMNPERWRIGNEKLLLLKVAPNPDTGRTDFFVMELNTDEAELIKYTPLALWE